MASGSSDDPRRYSTPPKLCFYSLPSLPPEPPGSATPPLHLPGSIPFLWEEAPGRPKRDPPPLLDLFGPARPARSPHLYSNTCSGGSSSSRRRRSLELPPGMVLGEAAGETKGEECSPTAVLDGPYALNEHAHAHAPPEESEGSRKVRITRFGSSRKRSLANVLSLRTTSHLWANIYASLKQVVSRRRARKTQVY